MALELAAYAVVVGVVSLVAIVSGSKKKEEERRNEQRRKQRIAREKAESERKEKEAKQKIAKLPKDSYTWKLNRKTCTKLSNESGTYFKSQPVIMRGFKWYLEFYPNYKQEGGSQLFLHLCHMPKELSSIKINYQLSVSETQTLSDVYTAEFNKEQGWGWTSTTLPTNAIENLSVLTLKADVVLVAVTDKDNKVVIGKYRREIVTKQLIAQEKVEREKKEKEAKEKAERERKETEEQEKIREQREKERLEREEKEEKKREIAGDPASFTRKCKDDKILQNVLILLICVCDYDVEYLKNLEGTKSDKARLSQLFRNEYGYKVITNPNPKVTKKDFKKLLAEAEAEFEGDDPNYQCVITIFSGHGTKDYLLLSDYDSKTRGMYERQALHQYFNGKKIKNKAKDIKIFFIDACAGDEDNAAVPPVPEYSPNVHAKGNNTNICIYQI